MKSLFILLASALVAHAAFDFENEAEAFSPYVNIQSISDFYKLKLDFKYDSTIKYVSGAPATSPWSSTYWPTFLDSTNFKWDGKSSAIEKYEKAFKVTGLKVAISQASGVLSQTLFSGQCKTNANCKSDEVCVDRGSYNVSPRFVCIPTWFGVCHAWAPASFMEAPPKRPVIANGVRFEINDLLALTIQMYNWQLNSKLYDSLHVVGRVCPKFTSSFSFDKFGRPTDQTCRDMNAGLFHVIITNIVGREKKTFFFNRRMDREIWNQPFAGYRIRSVSTLSASYARKLMVTRNDDYAEGSPFSPNAKTFKLVRTTIWYTEENDPTKVKVVQSVTTPMELQYILELDSAGKIVGGEWVGSSILSRPGYVALFNFGAEGYPHANLLGGLFKTRLVKALLDASRK